MNFSELSQIVRYLRKTLPCSHCQNTYENEHIEVLSTFDDQGLFNLTCTQCQSELLVHITINDDQHPHHKAPQKDRKTSRKHRSLTSLQTDSSLTHSHISTDDVINMHVFLNQFDGNFKELFSK